MNLSVVIPVFTVERVQKPWHSHLVDDPLTDGYLSARRGDMVPALCGYQPTGGWDRGMAGSIASCRRCRTSRKARRA